MARAVLTPTPTPTPTPTLTPDGCVYAYDVSTGAAAWTSCMPLDANGKRWIIEGSSVVGKLKASHARPLGGEIVIVASWDGHLYGLDGSNGHQLWNATLGPDYRYSRWKINSDMS